jgi:hypothetical protein
VPTSDPLRERQEIEDVVIRVFVATDRRDWASVEACLAEMVILDMTSLAGGEPLHVKPIDVIAAWKGGLEPIDQVHHQVGNFQIDVDGNRATAFCYGVAYHYRENISSPSKSRMFVGSYDDRLEVADRPVPVQPQVHRRQSGAREGHLSIPRMTKEVEDGPVRQEGIPESRKGDAPAQTRDVEERAFRKEGHEPEAGDRDRTLRGPARGGQGPAQEVVVEEEEIVVSLLAARPGGRPVRGALDLDPFGRFDRIFSSPDRSIPEPGYRSESGRVAR